MNGTQNNLQTTYLLRKRWAKNARLKIDVLPEVASTMMMPIKRTIAEHAQKATMTNMDILQ
jgi:hypothetical protein